MSFSINPVNKRIIYVVIADGQLVRAYADLKMAAEDIVKIKAMRPTAKVTDPIPLQMNDNQSIDSRAFDRVRSAW